METGKFSNVIDIGVTIVLSILIILVFLVGGYFYLELNKKYQLVSTQKAETESKLDSLSRERDNLLTDLEIEKNKVNSLSEAVGDISSTVGTLEKLSKTDPELLQKYSKVYFLNEHHTPDQLTQLADRYVFPEDRKVEVHSQVFPFLRRMLDEARRDGFDLKVASGYRSFDYQSSLKSNYKVVYGSGANQFSADQGYSEHQLGTAVDFTTETVGPTFVGFEKDPVYAWLKKNGHKYGFVLSYPEENKYYVFEPWHWRFVGVELATDLYKNGKNFYDIDQRAIDEYLVKIFD